MELYHLSSKPLNVNKVFKPRVPNNHLTDSGFENNTIPRISATTDIGNALSAIHTVRDGDIMNVYRIKENNPKIIGSSELVKQKLVPDAEFTNEIWIVQNVNFVHMGRIQVSIPSKTGPGYSKPIIYKYGDNNEHEGQVWYWDYKWINKTGY